MLQQTNLQTVESTTELFQKPKQPEYNKPEWFDAIVGNSYEARCRQIVKDFVQGNLEGKKTSRACNGNHSYTTKKGGTELWLFKNNPSIKTRTCVAKKVNGSFIGNASSLTAQRFPNGKIHYAGGGMQKIQECLQDVMPMVPFRMFKEARLDLDSFHIIEKGEGEMIDVGREEKGKKVLTHYTGAMLFTIGVRKISKGLMGYDEDHFLFDIDRNDLALKNFNVFLSKLARPCSSIADAYVSLKPKEIVDAERFMDGPCPRQGEWFFIPVQGEHENKKSAIWNRGRPARQNATLQAKGNRPHHVEQLSVEGYVKGKVTHGGMEHKPIELKQWHQPVPNTAVESFKISGAVD